MKREGNLYHKIYEMDNLRLALKKARKGKNYQKGVMEFDKDAENNLVKLHYIFRNKEYKTSPYLDFQIKEDKVRDISRLPFFPDRIGQHAIANIVEPILRSTFTKDTYAAIKGRGIHKASFALREALAKNTSLKYCLKIDIKKFYPSIDGSILKKLLRKKIKDQNILNVLDEIIDSKPGLPLGNYISQALANFYLTYFDHWLKEECKVPEMMRYCDDTCILADNKAYLHELLYKIKNYLKEHLNLELKDNYQIFNVYIRGIDFVGYVVFGGGRVRLRKRIKKRFAKMLKKNPNDKSIASYRGWLLHGNCRNLEKKLLNKKHESTITR